MRSVSHLGLLVAVLYAAFWLCALRPLTFFNTLGIDTTMRSCVEGSQLYPLPIS